MNPSPMHVQKWPSSLESTNVDFPEIYSVGWRGSGCQELQVLAVRTELRKVIRFPCLFTFCSLDHQMWRMRNWC